MLIVWYGKYLHRTQPKLLSIFFPHICVCVKILKAFARKFTISVLQICACDCIRVEYIFIVFLFPWQRYHKALKASKCDPTEFKEPNVGGVIVNHQNSLI